MKNEISQVEQRVKRYWYTDGIGELIGGGVFLILALYFTMQEYFGEQSVVGGLLQGFFIVIMIGAIFLGRKLVNFLKTRLTYPRTGYVEYRQSGRNTMWMRFLAVIVGMTVAMASIFITRSIESIDSMAAITGVLVAVIFLVKQGWSFGVARFNFFSLFSLVLGVILSVSGLPSGYNLGLFYGIMGVTLALSGGLILKRYLGDNPMAAEDRNG